MWLTWVPRPRSALVRAPNFTICNCWLWYEKGLFSSSNIFYLRNTTGMIQPNKKEGMWLLAAWMPACYWVVACEEVETWQDSTITWLMSGWESFVHNTYLNCALPFHQDGLYQVLSLNVFSNLMLSWVSWLPRSQGIVVTSRIKKLCIENTKKILICSSPKEKLTFSYFTPSLSQNTYCIKRENEERTSCFEGEAEGCWLPYDWLTILKMHLWFTWVQ